jgi:hypothetical protein
MLNTRFGTVQFQTLQARNSRIYLISMNSKFQHHYFPAGNGDVLDSVIHENIRLSDIFVSEIWLTSRTKSIPRKISCQN